MEYGISREEESKLPEFKNYAEAKKYFKDKYGINFTIIDCDVIDGKKTYFYKLILDREAYFEMISKLEENKPIEMSERYLFCSQDIQISEDGKVHIVH